MKRNYKNVYVTYNEGTLFGYGGERLGIICDNETQATSVALDLNSLAKVSNIRIAKTAKPKSVKQWKTFLEFSGK